MEALVSIYKKSHSVAVEINVPADFDTIEKSLLRDQNRRKRHKTRAFEVKY